MDKPPACQSSARIILEECELYPADWAFQIVTKSTTNFSRNLLESRVWRSSRDGSEQIHAKGKLSTGKIAARKETRKMQTLGFIVLASFASAIRGMGASAASLRR